MKSKKKFLKKSSLFCLDPRRQFFPVFIYQLVHSSSLEKHANCYPSYIISVAAFPPAPFFPQL